MVKTEALKKRITEEAQKKADEIIEQAERRAEEIIEEGRKNGQERKKEIISEAKEEAELKKHKQATLANLEKRKQVLTCKQQEITAVFERVLSKVQEMPVDGYRKIIADMLLKEVQSGEEEVVFSPRDRERLGADFLKKINQRLEKEDRKGDLTLSESTRDISGGFILREEGVENNNSFDELLNMEQDDLEAEVAELLFSES